MAEIMGSNGMSIECCTYPEHQSMGLEVIALKAELAQVKAERKAIIDALPIGWVHEGNSLLNAITILFQNFTARGKRCEAFLDQKQHAEELAEKAESALAASQAEAKELRALLNTPETEDFDKAVPLEAAHQVKRWGAEHDAGKNAEDWFWLVGYLAGKALAAFKAGDLTKAKHHTISTAAALRNWHAHIRSGQSVMRPGIAEEKQVG
jgi:hypothetical protein